MIKNPKKLSEVNPEKCERRKNAIPTNFTKLNIKNVIPIRFAKVNVIIN